MQLLQILNNILLTKNQVRDALFENDDISRYSVTLHNLLAEKYNESYSNSFRERYYTLSGTYRSVPGPEVPLDYDVNPIYYTSFDIEILTDIMEDVLNYRLQLKDRMNEYLDGEVEDNFIDYPTYLQYLLDNISTIATEDGIEAADEAYEGISDVELPTISYSNNKFTLSSTQNEAIIYYSIGHNGVPIIYDKSSDGVIISEEEDIWFWAKVGKNIGEKDSYSPELSSVGYHSFIPAPILYQEGNRIFISDSVDNASIHYSVDDGEWKVYIGPFLVNEDNSSVKTIACRDNEFSKFNTLSLSFEEEIDDNLRPDNVRCTFSPINNGATVTLTTSTTGAEIKYAIDESDGFYRDYSTPFDVESEHFLIYTYSIKDGISSKYRLVYKYDVNNTTKPDSPSFIDDGESLVIYSNYSDAVVCYRYSNVGSFTVTDTNYIKVYPTSKITVYAYTLRNGLDSDIVEHTFSPNEYGNTSLPKPKFYQYGNNISISSNYDILYTTDQGDPRTVGIQYNKNKGVDITKYTVIKAVATNGSKYSDVATASFEYDNTANSGGGSGSEGGGNVGDGDNGTITTDPFVKDNWLVVEGVSGIVIGAGDTLYFAYENSTYWKKNSSNTITGLDPNKKIYLKGNVSSFKSFTGSATLSGDLSTIKGGVIGVEDKIYRNLFSNCSGLVNVSNIQVLVSSTMPDAMFESTFSGCTDLVEAAFSIDSDSCSDYGMNNCFKGCSKLIGGPSFNFDSVGNYGLASAFQDCVKYSSTINLALNSTKSYSFASAFRNCKELVNVSISTPSDSAYAHVFDSAFFGCSSLSDGSSILFNYSSLGDSSLYRCFYNCNSLITGANIPATVHSDSSCASMYEGCTSLRNTPIVGVSTLGVNCCRRMFYGCSSLSSAPDLNALYLKQGCYQEMFRNCATLNHIKALFTSLPLSDYTANWVVGVASAGTFEVNREASWSSSSSYNYGVNSIPVGWTVVGAAVTGTITNIFSSDGYCYITASNSDDIYYATSSTYSTDTSLLTIKYTGPFRLKSTIYVLAATKNIDGVCGSVLCKEINPNYPKINIERRSGLITLSTGTEFQYDYIQYQICVFESDTVVQDWRIYNAPFSIDTNRRIKVMGFIDGSCVREDQDDKIYNTTSPTINFNITWNGTHTAALSIWLDISYPNTDVLNSLWFKVNDNENDNPDTAPSKWHQYSYLDLIREGYTDPAHPNTKVTAIANVVDSGVNVWTDTKTRIVSEEDVESLYEPVLVQLENSNNVLVEYNGERYPVWSDPDIIIEIRRIQVVRQYTNTFNISEWYNGSSAVDIYFEVRARIGDNISTSWKNQKLRWNPEWIYETIQEPEAYPVLENDKVMIYVNNNYYETGQCQNEFKIVVREYDKTGLTPSSGPYDGYYPYQSPYPLDSHIVKFQILARTKINSNYSREWDPDDPNIRIWDIKKDFGIAWDDRPVPVVTMDNSTMEITITTPYDVSWPEMKVEDPEWGFGILEPGKYDNWTTIGSQGFSGSNKVYKGYLDEHLASGKLYVRYTYDGISCPDDSPCLYYRNSSVQPVLAPTVSVEWDRNKGAYILYLTKNGNPDAVAIKFRMENYDWGGGFAQEDKYATPTVAGQYGLTLSPYLIRADIYGQTWSAWTGGELLAESKRAYKFENTHYTSLGTPKIDIKAGYTTNNAILVSNKNKNATNYFRLASTPAPVWSPSELDPTKYDNWMIAVNTGNDIDNDLWSGTFEAYSVWGNENTLDDIVTINYDTGQTLNDAAPTITVTPSTDFYNITITNNADRANFPFLKYKLDDIEWNNEEDVFCSVDNYQKSQGDEYLVTNNTSITFTVGKDVLNAKILAVATSSSSPTAGDRAIWSKLAEVDFVNELI